MSMWYEEAPAFILNDAVSPGLTLIDVAKPCSGESPAPLTIQSLSGSPTLVFSHAMRLTTGGPQGFPAAADGVAGRANAVKPAATATTPSRHFIPGIRDTITLPGAERAGA